MSQKFTSNEERKYWLFAETLANYAAPQPSKLDNFDLEITNRYNELAYIATGRLNVLDVEMYHIISNVNVLLKVAYHSAKYRKAIIDYHFDSLATISSHEKTAHHVRMALVDTIPALAAIDGDSWSQTLKNCSRHYQQISQREAVVAAHLFKNIYGLSKKPDDKRHLITIGLNNLYTAAQHYPKDAAEQVQHTLCAVTETESDGPRPVFREFALVSAHNSGLAIGCIVENPKDKMGPMWVEKGGASPLEEYVNSRHVPRWHRDVVKQTAEAMQKSPSILSKIQ